MIGVFSFDDSAAESIFKAVAVNIDKSTHKGDQWHKELLEQMTLNVPGLRVSVISTDTAQKLNHYRSFRHVFRNVYGFELSFNRIKELLELLPDTSVSIKKDLDNFICQMRTIYEVNK